MLQVVRVVVHGILFGLLNLQFDFIQRIWLTFQLEAADKYFVEGYTPAAMLQHPPRIAEAAEVTISIRPCHTTRFWCGKMFYLLHQRLLYPGII